MADPSILKLGLIHQPHPRMPRIGAALAGQVPPSAVDWNKFIRLDGDALGNDQTGNCVPCGVLRSIQIMRAVAAGDQRRPDAATARGLYIVWAGWDGVPGSATDLGTRSDVAAEYWACAGVPWGDQWIDIPALAGFDPRIVSHLRAAIAWLGPIQIDLNMPMTAQAQLSTWTVGTGSDAQPGSWGAHRVCIGAYGPDSFRAITWGEERILPDAFVETYALDAMASISRSWIDVVGRSPLGLDLDALEAASRRLAG